jgi:hypothetical protein
MARITRMLTYNMPDQLYSTETTLGKTSTQLYNGPDELILWISKETGRVMQSFEAENEPDRPLPLDLRREILRADTDENCIRIALIYGGLEKPKVYEVAVGPADQPNATIADPSDIRTVYDREPVDADYTAPLEFFVYKRDRSDETIRDRRNSLLAASDNKVAPDMPEEIRQKWIDYRQKLRDLPDDWADVPNYLIRFPLSPDQTINAEFDDPEVEVIRIEDRTDEDNDALSQLPPCVN